MSTLPLAERNHTESHSHHLLLETEERNCPFKPTFVLNRHFYRFLRAVYDEFAGNKDEPLFTGCWQQMETCRSHQDYIAPPITVTDTTNQGRPESGSNALKGNSTPDESTSSAQKHYDDMIRKNVG